MKYICFFDDGQYYYCYADNGKIYRGKDAQSFTPNFKYFLALILTPVIGKSLNKAFLDELNNTVAIILVFLGSIVFSAIGIAFYHKIIKQEKLTEIYLSDVQFDEYVCKGKKRFQSQQLILYACILAFVFFFVLFVLNKNLLLWFLGVLSVFLTTLGFAWINPLSKHQFFKEYFKAHKP